MNIRYRVTLNEQERVDLRAQIAAGKRKARELKRAQILLAADQGIADIVIARTIGTGPATIHRIKRRFVLEGLDAALHEAARPGGKRKLSGKEVALLIATACSAHPPGRNRWTLELLAQEVVRLTEHESLGRETVRRRLEESELKPWREKMWCLPQVTTEFVARMEDVLDLCAEPHDPKLPVVHFDESPVQLLGETRVPVPAKSGKLRRYDTEYVRKGTANLFVMFDNHRGWRHVEVTEQRTSYQFALQMKALVDEHYPEAERIRLVMDNLSTHTTSALYEAFEPAEARRLCRKLEIHYVPKHASWLNMVEIEIGVLKSQCLERRIPDRETLQKEVSAWEKTRNNSKARIHWTFTVDAARKKLGRMYQPLAEARDKESPKRAA